MPWARFETEFVRHEKVQAIPADVRPDAIALYVGAVLYCAELLTNGRISRAVLAGLCEEVGIKRPRKVLNSLEKQGLFVREKGENGAVFVHDYLEYQSSKQQVLERRAYEAEKKRRARNQGKLPLSPQMSLGDKEGDVPPGQSGGLARATRAGAEAEVDLERKAGSSTRSSTTRANGARGEELPVDLELGRARLMSVAPRTNLKMMDDFELPPAAWFAAAEQIEEQRPEHPEKYAFTLFQTWKREQRYTAAAHAERPFEGEEPS